MKKKNDMSMVTSIGSAAGPESGTTIEFMGESLKNLKARVNKINS